jgi:hypothetical protein|tara:strand:- start:1400 stop:1582 length:183 start_codon:yes stop_codon:yes gene_type:complete
MESVLPNLSALEGKVQEAVEEIKRLKSSSGNSKTSFDKKAIRKSIMKIIELIEDAEKTDS